MYLTVLYFNFINRSYFSVVGICPLCNDVNFKSMYSNVFGKSMHVIPPFALTSVNNVYLYQLLPVNTSTSK